MKAKPFAQPIALPAVRVPAELLPLALEIQAARVQAEIDGSLRSRIKNMRTRSNATQEKDE